MGRYFLVNPAQFQTPDFVPLPVATAAEAWYNDKHAESEGRKPPHSGTEPRPFFLSPARIKVKEQTT
jgi:hypothetical protein